MTGPITEKSKKLQEDIYIDTIYQESSKPKTMCMLMWKRNTDSKTKNYKWLLLAYYQGYINYKPLQ